MRSGIRTAPPRCVAPVHATGLGVSSCCWALVQARGQSCLMAAPRSLSLAKAAGYVGIVVVVVLSQKTRSRQKAVSSRETQTTWSSPESPVVTSATASWQTPPGMDTHSKLRRQGSGSLVYW
jgi:hypothetical protein